MLTTNSSAEPVLLIRKQKRVLAKDSPLPDCCKQAGKVMVSNGFPVRPGHRPAFRDHVSARRQPSPQAR